MWIWLGNQDEAVDPAKETGGAYRCQMVPHGAILVLLPPVTTGSEEDPGIPAGRLDPGFSPASRGDPGVSVVCALKSSPHLKGGGFLSLARC